MTVLVAGLLTVACRQPSTPSTLVLRWSAIPDRAAESVRAQHLPLRDLVCQAAAVECQWADAATYPEVVDKLGDGSVDVAFLGAVGFARAHARHGAVPMVMRDIDTRFTSVVVVRAGDSARSLRDLQGRSFTFGDRGSTSGHVMARHFLDAEGINPEKFFSRVAFSGAHDKTLAAVAAGEADAGVVSAPIGYEALASDGPYQGRLRMLWESPVYTDYVWTARRELPAELRQRLIDAFLDLDNATVGSRVALARAGAGGFLPAYAGDFRLVTGVLERAGAL
jgi:phosphonate transport system substrate-binding protein